jgi:methanethiol S-methyltransferase
MSRWTTLIFSVVCYLIFFATFLYLIAFVGNLPGVPVTVDRGPPAPFATALAIDVALIVLFAVQHSGMARRGFKKWWTQFVPVQVERSLYVLAASLVLILLFLLWRPIGGLLWSIEDPTGQSVMWSLFGLGWLIVLLSTFLINHFELFGLQQAWFNLRQRQAAAPEFRQPFLYRLVRHPLYLGFFIALWATPVMSVGHMLLAGGLSIWMLIAIQLEERDLVALFGDAYESYRRNVGMIIPFLGRRA